MKAAHFKCSPHSNNPTLAFVPAAQVMNTHSLQFGLRLPELLQLVQNRRFQTFWLRHTPPPLLDLTICADQELLKVPFDPLQSQQSRGLLLHPLIHRLRLIAIDIRFAKDWERDAIVDLTELLDGVIRARVLVAKLVAREADNEERFGILGFDLLVEFFETLELGREAAFGGGVHHEDNFALEIGKRVGLALFWTGNRRSALYIAAILKQELTVQGCESVEARRGCHVARWFGRQRRLLLGCPSIQKRSALGDACYCGSVSDLYTCLEK